MRMLSQKMNLLLVNLSPMPMGDQEGFLNKSQKRVPTFETPLGLLELAAYVRKRINNINIALLDIAADLHKIYLNRDVTQKMSVEQFIGSELDAVNRVPDVVGISIMFTNSHKSALKLAEMIKEKWNNSIVICGGHQATNCFDHFLSNRNIDYVLKGEGELSFVEFLKEYDGTTRQDREMNIPGIYNRQKLKNATNKNESSPMIVDLDDIPMPAYDLCDIDFYRKKSNIKDEGAIHTMWSRGCPFKCTFCASHAVHGRSMRFKSNDKIIMELHHIIEDLNFRKVWIEDDLFAINKKKLLELVDRIMANGWHGKIGIRNGLSVIVIDEEIIDAISEMGINQISLNIESGSLYTQKHIIRKNVPLDKAKRLIQYARKKDMKIDVPIILGFPGETLELMHESIKFAYSVDVDWVHFISASPLPGSEMFEQFVEMGVIDPETYDWDSRWPRRDFDTPEITGVKLTQLVYDTHIALNFFNNNNLKHGRYKRAINYFTRRVIDRYPFHVVAIYCRGLAYMGLGEEEDAVEDFKKCVRLIGSSEKSINGKAVGDLQNAKQLFDRYCDRMPYLQPYLNG